MPETAIPETPCAHPAFAVMCEAARKRQLPTSHPDDLYVHDRLALCLTDSASPFAWALRTHGTQFVVPDADGPGDAAAFVETVRSYHPEAVWFWWDGAALWETSAGVCKEKMAAAEARVAAERKARWGTAVDLKAQPADYLANVPTDVGWRDGWLCVRDVSCMWDEPVVLRHWWPARAEPWVRNKDWHGKRAYRHAAGWYQVEVGDGFVRPDVRLKDGGSTQAMFTERWPVPKPRVSSGVQTRFRNARWEKLLKKGWVSA